MSSSLLGYPLRRAAAMEMLHGGCRVTHLVQAPHPIHTTRSEHLPMPSPKEEAAFLDLDYQWMGERLIPVNVGGRSKTHMAEIRAKDLYDRFQQEKSASHHPSPSDLTILTMQKDTSTIGYSVFGIGRRFMPSQIVKPMAHRWAPALRGAGLRAHNSSMFQERIDQKGFGEKRKSRSLWQQDINTQGFKPKRFY